MSSQDHTTQPTDASSGWIIPDLDELSHIVSRALGKADIVYRADGLTFLMIEADDATVEALALFGEWRTDMEDCDPAEDDDPAETELEDDGTWPESPIARQFDRGGDENMEDDDPSEVDDPGEREDNGWPNPDPWGDTLVQGRRI